MRMRTLLGLAILVCVAGCATSTAYPSYFGGQVHSVADPLPLDVARLRGGLVAQASVYSDMHGRVFKLLLSNRGERPVRLSHVSDHYVAKTRAGRTVPLEAQRFLDYPLLLRPGEEATVLLRPPTDVSVDEVTHIIGTLDDDHTIVALQASTLRAQVPVDMPPTGPGTIPLTATVPMTVEFDQTLGTLLTLELQWDDSGEVITLPNAAQRTFELVAGQHELHLVSRMPQIGETHARVPIAVGIAQPMRVTIDARPHLTGVQLRVQVWVGNDVVSDWLFGPSDVADH